MMAFIRTQSIFSENEDNHETDFLQSERGSQDYATMIYNNLEPVTQNIHEYIYLANLLFSEYVAPLAYVIK